MVNPWEGFHKSAPFDREYFLILNVAIGGTGYFPDTATNEGGKPWSNTSPQVRGALKAQRNRFIFNLTQLNWFQRAHVKEPDGKPSQRFKWIGSGVELTGSGNLKFSIWIQQYLNYSQILSTIKRTL